MSLFCLAILLLLVVSFSAVVLGYLLEICPYPPRRWVWEDPDSPWETPPVQPKPRRG